MPIHLYTHTLYKTHLFSPIQTLHPIDKTISVTKRTNSQDVETSERSESISSEISQVWVVTNVAENEEIMKNMNTRELWGKSAQTLVQNNQ